MASEIKEIREALMDTLRKLRSGEVDVHKAKAIASVSQVMINTYSLQVRAINALGGDPPRALLIELGGETLDAPAAARAPQSVKRLAGAPSVGPNEGIHAADPLRTVRRVG